MENWEALKDETGANMALSPGMFVELQTTGLFGSVFCIPRPGESIGREHNLLSGGAYIRNVGGRIECRVTAPGVAPKNAWRDVTARQTEIARGLASSA